jgi:hypothetical protein
MKRYRSLGRLKTGVMNKTERAYSIILNLRQIKGEVLWFKFEGIKLRLADNTFLTPDFFVMTSNNELECHECKGGLVMEDAWVKLKVAAELFPFRFYKCTKLAERLGGSFKIEEL